MTLKKLFLSVFIFLPAIHLFAQWNYSPVQNNALDSALNKRDTNPAICEDGNGGYFITWMKSVQAVYGAEIYAQHINGNGAKLWSDTGVVICNAALNQYWPKIIPDGSGGAIITWQDCRLAFSNWDIYAQRINAGGAVQWANNGIPVLNNAFINEVEPEMISDGNGGAIIAIWQYSGSASDIYCQRINGSGSKLWGANGTIICNAPNRQDVPKITTDGSGGAIITWWDFRNSPTDNVTDVFAQRVDANGATLWTNNGVPVAVMPYDQDDVQIINDNNHGAYIVWTDFRNSTPTTNVLDIYAQHLNGSGAPVWATNGISVCSAPNQQLAAMPIMDDNGGLIVAWHDIRSGSAIYAQRFTSAGSPVWTVDGVPACTNANNAAASPYLMSDGNNGVIILWEDRRTGNDKNIYAQHFNSAAVPLWPTNGIPLCTSPKDQLLNVSNGQIMNGGIVKNGFGGVVVTWEDGRNDVANNGDDDIYISVLSDVPATSPIVSNITGQCPFSPSARGKLANPPRFASISILVDNTPVTYSPSDSSFEYFTSGVTAVGTHTVSTRYTNFAGYIGTDIFYTVSPAVTPGLVISGNTTVNQGQSTTLTATATNGGNTPMYQWQDSTQIASWTNIPGATNTTLVYTPAQTGNKVRCGMSSNANCASPPGALSNVLTFTVNPVTAIDPVPANNYGIIYFPNPVNKMLIIDSLKINDRWQSIELVSMDGKQVMNSNSIRGKTKLTLDLEWLPAGEYIAVLKRKQGEWVYLKLIKH